MVLAPCAPGPCRNGGECKASEDYESFSCVCPPGWQGEASCSPQPWLGPGSSRGWETERGQGLRPPG